MFEVRSKKDLEICYLILLDLQKDGYKHTKRVVKAVKKGIREYYRRQRLNEETIILGQDDSSYIMLFPLEINPDVSLGDAFDYAYEKYWEHSMPSMYDCTGQHFTEFMKVARRQGEWWVYNFIGIDI